MPPDKKGAEALKRYRAEQSEMKQRGVLRSIQEITAEGRSITISSVARTAKVSREFIHHHKHLHEAVVRAATQAVTEQSRTDEPDANLARGLRADRSTLLHRIEEQKGQIAEQKKHLEDAEQSRQRWLGLQLTERATVDPLVHAELRITNERLMSDNDSLSRQIRELQRLVTTLEEDLAVSRQAHNQDIMRLSNDTGSVLPFSKPTSIR